MKVMTIGELLASQARPTAYEDALAGCVKKPYDEEPYVAGHTLLSTTDGKVVSLTNDRFYAPVMELLYNCPELFKRTCGKNLYIVMGLGDLHVSAFEVPGTANIDATPILRVNSDGSLIIMPKHAGNEYKFSNVREFIAAYDLDDTVKAVSIRRAYNEIVGLL